MSQLTFNKNHVRDNNRVIAIRVRPFPKEEVVKVTSEKTGVSKLFKYDREATTEEYMMNEGWDGEQDLKIYRNGPLTLRLWNTPYDGEDY